MSIQQCLHVNSSVLLFWNHTIVKDFALWTFNQNSDFSELLVINVNVMWYMFLDVFVVCCFYEFFPVYCFYVHMCSVSVSWKALYKYNVLLLWLLNQMLAIRLESCSVTITVRQNIKQHSDHVQVHIVNWKKTHLLAQCALIFILYVKFHPAVMMLTAHFYLH